MLKSQERPLKTAVAALSDHMVQYNPVHSSEEGIELVGPSSPSRNGSRPMPPPQRKRRWVRACCGASGAAVVVALIAYAVAATRQPSLVTTLQMLQLTLATLLTPPPPPPDPAKRACAAKRDERDVARHADYESQSLLLTIPNENALRAVHGDRDDEGQPGATRAGLRVEIKQ